MTFEMRKLERSKLPNRLLAINDAPQSLYVKGKLPGESTKILSVVGSRSFTTYGKQVCEKLIEDLKPYNVSILSGLALGIDSIAHRKALDVDLHTIAVPGSGLDESVLYPRSHIDLSAKILENGGALLSEFEPKTNAAPYMFPKRNRVISGLSHGVLIIEGGQKSGTMITARLAQEQRKPLFAVPNSIYSTNSSGTNLLIHEGAIAIVDGSQIAERLGLQKTATIETSTTLKPLEKDVYEHLGSPITIEELSQTANIPVLKLHPILSALELKKTIEIKVGRIYRLK